MGLRVAWYKISSEVNCVPATDWQHYYSARYFGITWCLLNHTSDYNVGVFCPQFDWVGLNTYANITIDFAKTYRVGWYVVDIWLLMYIVANSISVLYSPILSGALNWSDAQNWFLPGLTETNSPKYLQSHILATGHHIYQYAHLAFNMKYWFQ